MKNEQREPGSRDIARDKIRQTGEAAMEALIEVNKLRGNNKRKVEYRYADSYLGIAIQYIELAKIVMRKKKRSEPKVEAQASPEASLVQVL